jgi:hypothetical protein
MFSLKAKRSTRPYYFDPGHKTRCSGRHNKAYLTTGQNWGIGKEPNEEASLDELEPVKHTAWRDTFCMVAVTKRKGERAGFVMYKTLEFE